MSKCKHKLGKIQDDGYQYCEKCGVAVCVHKWGVIDKVRDTIYGKIAYSLQCTKCGDIKSHVTTLD